MTWLRRGIDHLMMSGSPWRLYEYITIFLFGLMTGSAVAFIIGLVFSHIISWMGLWFFILYVFDFTLLGIIVWSRGKK